MSMLLLSPPAAEPVSVEEVKSHLRISHSHDDSYLATLLAAARSHIETVTRKRMITQSWRLMFDSAGKSGRLFLPVGPVQSVSRVLLFSSDDTSAELDSAGYEVDITSDPARIRFETMPLAHRTFAGIGIDVTVGYGAAGNAMPVNLRHAILLLAGHLYGFREVASADGRLETVPVGFEALIAPFRTRTAGALS